MRGWFCFAIAGFFAGFTMVNELPAAAFAVGLGLLLLVRSPRRTLLAFAPAALLPIAALLALNYAQSGHPLDIGYTKFGSEWYEYEGSHWRPLPDQPKRGIDWAHQQESRATYAFHLLLGHHGWLSLTPFYLLGLAGMAWGVRRWFSSAKTLWAELAVSTLLLSLVVFGWYILIVGNRTLNYGGWSNGPRWLMWLAPLWLLAALPCADWLGHRRWGRAVCIVLLVMSVLSAHYWIENPWRHPWIYNWMDAKGWIAY